MLMSHGRITKHTSKYITSRYGIHFPVKIGRKFRFQQYDYKYKRNYWFNLGKYHRYFLVSGFYDPKYQQLIWLVEKLSNAYPMNDSGLDDWPSHCIHCDGYQDSNQMYPANHDPFCPWILARKMLHKKVS